MGRSGRNLGHRWPYSARGALDDCASNANHRGQAFKNLFPGPSFIARAKELPAAGTEVNPDRIACIGCHRITQDGLVSTFLRQASYQRLPGNAAIAGSINAQPAVGCAAKLIRLNWNGIDAVWISGVHEHGKTKIGGHSIGYVGPAIGAVVRAIEPPMILQEQAFGTSRMDRDLVYALPELGI